MTLSKNTLVLIPFLFLSIFSTAFGDLPSIDKASNQQLLEALEDRLKDHSQTTHFQVKSDVNLKCIDLTIKEFRKQAPRLGSDGFMVRVPLKMHLNWMELCRNDLPRKGCQLMKSEHNSKCWEKIGSIPEYKNPRVSTEGKKTSLLEVKVQLIKACNTITYHCPKKEK